VKTPFSFSRRAAEMLRLSRVRVISQVFFLVLFVLAAWAAWTTRIGGFPVSRFLEIDPLVLLSTALSTGWVYRALGWAMITVALTLLFGRVFCNWVCPLGTLSQFAGRLLRTQSPAGPPDRNRYLRSQTIKYMLLVALLIMAGFGVLQIGLLDPISLLHRTMTTALQPASDLVLDIPAGPEGGLDRLKFAPGVARRVFAGSFVIGAMVFFLLVLNVFHPRWFCRVLCPLGALLGVLSRFAVFRILRDPDACTGCRLCLTRCEGGCDPDGNLRLAECFGCMNCLDDCPEGALRLTITGQGNDGVIRGPDIGRRRLILSSIAALAAVPLLKNDLVRAGSRDRLIRPPGSVAETGFLERCIKCDRCLDVCPTNVLQPASFGQAGLTGLWTPVLDFDVGHCQLSCTLCSEVCPTGAIRRITVDEKLGLGDFAERGPIVLGTAFFDLGRCLPHAMDIPCVVCQEVCPVSPKAIQTRRETVTNFLGKSVALDKPFIIPERCIGCGICQEKCPVGDLRAIRVASIGESRSPRRRLLDRNQKGTPGSRGFRTGPG